MSDPDVRDGDESCRGFAQLKKPSQIKFIRPGQMAMFARVFCHPPLGQATVVPQDEDELRFTIVLESSRSLPEQNWEAAIHDPRDPPVNEPLVLARTDDVLSITSHNSEEERNLFKYTFTGVVKTQDKSFQVFNVLFRNNHAASWRRAEYEHGLAHGRLIFQDRSEEHFESEESFLHSYFPHLPKHIRLESRPTSSPEVKLVSVTGKAESKEKSENGSAYHHISIGKPQGHAKYFSLVRTWVPWLAPRHGSAEKKFYVSEDAMVCSFLTKKGSSLIMLAVSGIEDVQTLFQSNDKGELVIQARDDSQGAEACTYRLICALSENYEEGLQAVMQEARKLVMHFVTDDDPSEPSKETTVSPPDSDTVLVENDDIGADWLSSWFDGLSWCTWNGLGQKLTEAKILEGLDSLKRNDIAITNLIIDDNWQSLDSQEVSQFQQGMTDFDANKEGFPNGLKHTTSLIRKNHPNIESIAVWHALLGYWGGISPEGSIARNYKTTSVVKAAGVAEGTMLAIDPDDVQRFYNDFYSFLRSAGVDGVKTDAQFFLDMLENREDRRRFTKAYQDAWSISSLRCFSNKTISCMSQVPQIIFHSQLPSNKPTNLVRNSDDFFPDIPGSHPWHIFCNAHNSLLTLHLNALPDWDMFQTVHSYGSFHGAARCISGGPIYITDEPGKHDVKLINQMTARTVRGNTIILRPAEMGRTLDMYNDYNEGHVLRIGTRTGFGKYITGIMGLFNIAAGEKCSVVPLADFFGVHKNSDNPYIIRSFQTGKVSKLMKPKKDSSTVAVALDTKGWEILSSYRAHCFKMRNDTETHVAVLGLVDKITGAAATVTQDIYVEENGRLRVEVAIKALGVLGLYVSNLEDKTVNDDFMVMFLKRPIPKHTVKKSKNGQVLEIDIATAWKEMGLRPGWSNELHVDIFMN